MTVQTPPAPAFDVDAIRKDFPVLAKEMRGQRLAFLDSAASAQKPRQVVEATAEFYEGEYANIHRGAYWLSERATARYEEARETVRAFLNAEQAKEVIFVRGATEGLNLIASSYGRKFLSEGDEVILTGLEHHSNIVPWQMLRDEKGIVIKVAPVQDDGSVTLDSIKELIGPKTKIVSVAHVSNALGTVLPVKDIAKLAHDAGAICVVDGCQAAPHLKIDVQDIGADFYVFSGHKVYGPTGIGAVYGREELLNAMPPYQGGGDMITSVTFEKTTWAPLPAKFEAGTPAIAQAVGLGVAIDYVNALGFDAIHAHEHDLLEYATRKLEEIEGLKIYGTAPGKAAVISFTLDCAHPHDMATILDRGGVAVRAGHHCAQPVMDRFQIPATTRASFGIYNTRADVDQLIEALTFVRELFG